MPRNPLRTVLRAAVPLLALGLATAGCSAQGSPLVPFLNPGGSGLEGVKAATVQILADGEIRNFEGSTSFHGSGSGFVLDRDGHIVTNNHVVTGAGALRVRIGGVKDDEYPAKVVGVNECSDLAVIQLTEKVDAPTLGWSDRAPEPPLAVYTAGFPLGDPEFTMTKGIVSKASAAGDTSWASVRRVIEHDAAIQPGNSGGPLVDETGRVVAVNYAGGNPGTGTAQYYAISATDAKPLVETLLEGDEHSIGVNGSAILDDESGLAGIWVAGVAAGRPAAKTGVKPGDLITHLNGVAMTSGTYKEYCNVLRSNDIDDAMSVRVLRLDTKEILEGEINGRELQPVFSFENKLQDQVSDTGPSASAETSEVVDDTGTMSMIVPTSWADRSTVPTDMLGTGVKMPQITASTSIAQLNQNSAPGIMTVYFTGVGQFGADQLIDSMVAGVGADCAETVREDFDNNVVKGRYAAVKCSGNAAGDLVGILLVASADSDPNSVLVGAAAALTDGDLRAIDTALTSLTLR